MKSGRPATESGQGLGGKVVDVQNEKWTQDPDTTVCWQQAPEDLKLTGGGMTRHIVVIDKRELEVQVSALVEKVWCCNKS